MNSTNVTPKLPEIPVHERSDFKFIVAAGFVLAMIAGFLNICSILATTYTVSHNTGIYSRMSHQFSTMEFKAAFFKLFVVLSYVVGSGTVGFFIQKEKFSLSRKYGLLFITESVLIFIVIKLYENGEHTWSVFISSFAMGLQNALFTNFSGAVVRTTHVTGLLTDIGLIIGHKIRGTEQTTDLWRLRVLVPLMIGFFSGGFFGSIAYRTIGVDALYIPCVTLMAAGIVWTAARLKKQMNATPKYNSNYEKF